MEKSTQSTSQSKDIHGAFSAYYVWYEKYVCLLDSVSQIYKRQIFHHGLSYQREYLPCYFRILIYPDKLSSASTRVIFLWFRLSLVSLLLPHILCSHFNSIFLKFRACESPFFPLNFSVQNFSRDLLFDCPKFLLKILSTSIIFRNSS